MCNRLLRARFCRVQAVPSILATILSIAGIVAGEGVSTRPVVRLITVSADGSGDFKTLQGAIASIREPSPLRTIIQIKPGVYQGQILLSADKPDVTFEGEDAGKCILTYGLNQQEPVPAGDNPSYPGTGVVILGDHFRAENITFQNTSGDHGQAIALRLEGDKAVLKNCRMLGWQDTLRVNKKRQYFRDCYIEGRTDFIYGSATAVFDRCEIHSKNGGYVTAADTPWDQPFGYVFFHCRLTGDAIPWKNPAATQPAKITPMAYLGRPWRPYASVTFIECDMGAHVRPVGWDNWRNAANEKTARYAEYKSTGPGADPQKRASWSRQLSDDEAKHITVESMLDRWDAARE